MSSTLGSSTKTGWKRRSSAASFSMCLRYSSSVVAPTARSSPRASIGLSRLAASTAPSAAPAPTIVCSSSRNRMIRPWPVGDLLEHGLEPVLELAAVLGAGDQRADVERDHAPVAQRVGDVAGDDALGEPLDDRGLADAGLADQDRVVLGAPGQHLDHAADLVVAPDHRVELALLGRLGQVAPVGLERLVLVLGVLVGDAVRAAHLLDGLGELVARGARVGLRVGGERQQQVLGRDVLVAHAARLVVGALEQVDQGAAERGGRAGVAGDRRQRVRRLVGAATGALGIGSGALEHRARRCRRPARAARAAGARARPRGCGARRRAAGPRPGPPET